MAYTPTDLLEVRAWGATVGALALDSRTGFYAFEYDPGWVRSSPALDPLNLPSSGGVFTFPQLPPHTYHRLPAVIADSIPGDFGNTMINEYMVLNGIDPSAITPADRLAYLADRGVGALEYAPPADVRAAQPTAVDLAELRLTAAEVVQGTIGASPRSTARTLAELIEVGSSAGGARAKALVWFDPDTARVESGHRPSSDMQAWLVKFDGAGGVHGRSAPEDYTRVEYAYHLMAQAAGVAMSECRLLADADGYHHFMTRRFDRDGQTKLHMASLCALAHMDFNDLTANSYEQMFSTMGRLGLGEPAQSQAFARMVFNVAAVNCDDHTKNISFLLPQAGRWQLSPAYDLTFAWRQGTNNSQHLMSVNGKRWNISRADLLAVADRFQIPDARSIIRQVSDTVGNFEDFAAVAGVSPTRVERIRSAMDSQTLHPLPARVRGRRAGPHTPSGDPPGR